MGELVIGADGSWMQWHRTGIGRYLDGLLHALERHLAEEDRLVVFYNTARSRGRRLFHGARTSERFIRLPNRTLWNQVRVPLGVAAARCDVYLAGAIVAPWMVRTPCVPVVHDCLAFRDPAAKPGREGRYWRLWTRAAARRAPRLIAVSSFVAADCERFLGVDPERVEVVPEGVDTVFSPPPPGTEADIAARLRQRLGLPERFVLQVGPFDRHKDPRTAAAALALLRERGEEVVLVRCGFPGGGDIGGRRDAVLDLGYVDDPTLVDLYRCAAALCVTSTHEGFGLPVLEALACGTPVVASRAGGLPETGGDAALYFEPGDAAGLAASLERVLDAALEERLRRREAGLRHAARFRWDATAESVLGILRGVAGFDPRAPIA